MAHEDNYPHTWVKSTLGHGEQMCQYCHCTNREAAALGILNFCDRNPQYVQEMQKEIAESSAFDPSHVIDFTKKD